jgi:hypothetical protein
MENVKKLPIILKCYLKGFFILPYFIQTEIKIKTPEGNLNLLR